MLAFLYSVLIFKYKLATSIFAIFNKKARLRIKGLNAQQSDLGNQLSSLSNNRILIHCASLGEYEQATPVVNWILRNTEYDIVVSFFSSSGYKNCDLPSARCIKCYLPFDLNSDIKPFLQKVNPSKVIITKNEWWWNMLHNLKLRKTPTFLISSTIRNNHYFIKYPLSFFKDRLTVFNSVFVLNKTSGSLLSQIYFGNITVSGDTRKDQVLDIKNKITAQKRSVSTIIYGSAWFNDLPIIKEMISELPNYNHFIYPHNLNTENINNICAALNCEVKDSISSLSGTYVINSMGQLKKDYSEAQIAYIGGGFGEGIHNILEASVNNIPVLFGPRFQKSEEAKELLDLNVAYSVSKPSQLKPILNNLCTNEYQEEINLKLKDYFSTSKSATEIICAEIFK
ncbi:MAG: 3-deoxy-D-manno-octulosonic-acid transferase [Saprospiraceae bacterium]|jgi:3-deoxy-D-manno-octulosonic-acid transferase